MSGISVRKIISDFSVGDIPWEEGRFLYKLWSEKIADGKIPARADFTPFELRSVLPYIVLLDIPENAEEISCRLVGSYIVSMMDTDHTGKLLKDVAPAPKFLKRLMWQIEHKKPYILTKVAPEWSQVTYRDYNILSLPLSSDGERVDMIMALTNPYKGIS